MRVYWLGAGASCTYSGSKCGFAPPLASNMFRRFFDLEIAADPQVPVGNVVKYVRETKGIPDPLFGKLDENAEDFLSELDDRLNRIARRFTSDVRQGKKPSPERMVNLAALSAAYDQTVWMFARTLNETQNGSRSAEYQQLISRLGQHDSLITFNWDTLLDRCLQGTRRWFPETGYGIQFQAVHDGSWRQPRPTSSSALLLKLHGSTNWLVPYITRSLHDGTRIMPGEPKPDAISLAMAIVPKTSKLGEGLHAVELQPEVRQEVAFNYVPVPIDESPAIRPLCFVKDGGRFDTFRNRYRGGYKPFTYYYPPNHPKTGAPTMPLLIPPTRRKLFHEFGFVFKRIWQIAEQRVRAADDLVIIGFSFPPTDTRARKLLARALRRRSRPLSISIVDPDAKSVRKKLAGFLDQRSFRINRTWPSFQKFLASSRP